MHGTLVIRNPVARVLVGLLLRAAAVLWWIGFPLVVFAIYRAMYV
ncbi:hypothetical protein [Aureimonas sp. N4]|nr:hypothetical protein [Aureimonas sp. N4]